MSFLRRISIIGIMLLFCALGKRCVAGFTQPMQRCLRATSVRCYSKNLWSVEECREHRDTIKFVDGSCYHKGDRNGRTEYVQYIHMVHRCLENLRPQRCLPSYPARFSLDLKQGLAFPVLNIWIWTTSQRRKNSFLT
jgi:hypothetical protein